MDRIALCFAVVWLAACPSPAESGACQADTDCKGDRICSQSVCADPGGGSATAGEGGTSGDVGTGEGGGMATEADSTGSDDTPTSAADGSSSEGASTTGTGDGGVPEQPYGTCKATCTADADCCPDGCPSGTNYTCDEGLCRAECVVGNCGEISGFTFACVAPLMALPGESFCGAVCEGNDCSDIGPAPEFYCNPDQTYEPRVCGYDCRVESGPGCTGSSGSECLVTGGCGCTSDGDCRPGSVCFKQWTP